MFRHSFAVLIGLLLAGFAAMASSGAQAPSPESRAVAYLVKEVPRWKAEHPCYSCHNNGDATRALLAARQRGHDIGSALDDTLAFLNDPARWDQNKTQGGDDDKPLARLHFASALAASEAAAPKPSAALVAAARIIEADQKQDGSWTLDASQSLGSPTTYGTALATASARSTLIAAGREPDDFAVAQIDRWMRTVEVANVIDAAAVVLGLGISEDVMGDKQRRQCLAILREGQSKDGGWGPFVSAAPQVFDTAVAVLALTQLLVEPRLARSTYRVEELKDAIARGRVWLVAQQRSDGSWPETTRPANQESYAQRISTTGWALLALLATP
jgi:hypothetical protein